MAEISFEKQYTTPQEVANIVVLAKEVNQLSALYYSNAQLVKNDAVLIKLFTVVKKAIYKSTGKPVTQNN